MERIKNSKLEVMFREGSHFATTVNFKEALNHYAKILGVTPKNRILLFVDGARSLKSYEIILLAHKLGIILYLLPPYATYFM